MVLRGHPNWAEKIGIASGESIEKFYKDWCDKNGITMLGSASKQNTSDLIKLCDHLILNGSSAAYEAGILGKRITCLGNCHYSTAGIAEVYLDEAQLHDFDPEKPGIDSDEVIRKTLRFVYSFAYRYALFQNSIKANSTTNYSYSSDFDIRRLEKMMKSGEIIFEDELSLDDSSQEDQVISLIKSGDWASFLELPVPEIKNQLKVGRKGIFRYIESVRNLLPRGDR